MPGPEISNLRTRLSEIQLVHAVGRVQQVDEATIWVSGLTDSACLGDRVRVFRKTNDYLEGEVLRIQKDLVCILPHSTMEGVAKGDRAAAFGAPTLAPDDSWIGRIIDAYGRPMDGGPLMDGPVRRGFRASPPPAAARKGLGARLGTGLAVFDTVLPLARGQRIGLFAGSGVGKSRLLARLAQGVEADIVVLALVGERGREVTDFVQNVLGTAGMARSVVVAATSDRSALERRRCPMAAMSIAEHFRDQGKQVLFLADSVTRFAEAHREVAVASGELPALRGYPATVSNMITKLAERAGPGTPGTGDITAIFSVLVAGSDMDEPIADILRGVLDGHVVMDRGIAERGRYPAIDLLKSVSRSLPEVANIEENAAISTARRLLGSYQNVETMIKAGLYQEGEDPEVDRAVKLWPDLDRFLSESAIDGPEAAFKKLNLILRRSQNLAGTGGQSAKYQGDQNETRLRR